MIEYNKKDESVGFMKDYTIYTDDITGEMITDDYYYLVDGLMLSEETVLSLHEEEVEIGNWLFYHYEYYNGYEYEQYSEDRKDEFLENFEKVVIE